MSTTQDTWKKESGYIWSMIGSAIGFANILSFSALCYKNGGGAFLIPYILAHTIIGLPMLFLEGIIGQKTRLPLVSAMGNIAGTSGRMLGWLGVLTCATIGGFYIVLTGFAVAYSYFSAAGMIGHDTAFFFKQTFLHDSGSIGVLGGFAGSILISTLIVSVIAWVILARNIQTGVEKLCSIFLPLLAVLVVSFMLTSCFLPGALQGFKNFLIPDFAELKSWTLWRDVFGQVFLSLSLGLGIVTGYSRHNPSTFSIPRAMVRVAIGDFVISFLSGFAIFGCVGYMSTKGDIPLSSIVTSDSAFEIGFVIFPMILAQFGEVISRIVGPIFFFCVFIAGITGVFSIVENVAGNFEVEFRKSRKVAVAIAMGIVTLLAIPFCMGNGQHVIGAMAPMVLGNTMLMCGIGEIVIFLMISQVVSRDAVWMLNNRRTLAFISIKYFILPMLVFSLMAAVLKEFSSPFQMVSLIRWGWFCLVVLVGYMLSRRHQSYAQADLV
ncbi:MAG: sodium-dependent transporter [Chlamydiia bacterium]|nr:sodium-dependent transporter [Chlamydiia bacterium]